MESRLKSTQQSSQQGVVSTHRLDAAGERGEVGELYPRPGRMRGETERLSGPCLTAHRIVCHGYQRMLARIAQSGPCEHGNIGTPGFPRRWGQERVQTGRNSLIAQLVAERVVTVVGQIRPLRCHGAQILHIAPKIAAKPRVPPGSRATRLARERCGKPVLDLCLGGVGFKREIAYRERTVGKS